MGRKFVQISVIVILLSSFFGVPFRVEKVQASETIYIRADGSIDPSTANITSADNITYTFTDNNYDSIVVERDNIVIDGAGYEVKGAGSGVGLDLSDRNNISIRHVKIDGFGGGLNLVQTSSISIWRSEISNNIGIAFNLWGAESTVISECNLTANGNGIWDTRESHNSVFSDNIITNNTGLGLYLGRYSVSIHINGNIIANNGVGMESNMASGYVIFNNTIRRNVDGIFLYWGGAHNIIGNRFLKNSHAGIVFDSTTNYHTIIENTFADNNIGVDGWVYENNQLYHNNFINNTIHAQLHGEFVATLDNGYPSGGNFWSDYNGTDLYRGPYQNETESDDIGDTPHIINDYSQDNYPLIHPWPYPDIIPPKVKVLSPKNQTYATDFIPVTFTLTESSVWMGFSLDSQANVTITGNTTITEIAEGTHSIILYANDTSGNMGISNTVLFTVDTISPNITILQPENIMYLTDSAPLVFTVDEPVSWMAYDLDFQGNVTIDGNVTLSGLASGLHNLTVYANDTVGHMDASETVQFTVAKHDLAVTRIISLKSVIGQNYSTPINVTIENQGDTYETFQVVVYANTSAVGQAQNITVNTNGSVTLIFTWNSTGFTKGTYQINAHVFPVLFETDLVDNTRVDGWVVVTIPGDVDGDADIDIFDVVLIATAYGSYLGDQLYVTNYDIDGDGDIDIFDIVVAAGHYGESW